MRAESSQTVIRPRGIAAVEVEVVVEVVAFVG
jgi:hypothetical protein